MLRPFRALASALALAFALPACAQTPATPPAATKDADPALWVVKDQDTTVYLFGTIHVLKPGLTWFDEAVKKAFDDSGQLVLEMVEPPAEQAQAIVQARATLPAGGPSLTDSLPADKRAAYAKAVAGIGMPAASFDRYKPWFAAVNLSLLPLMKAGYDPTKGPESVLTAAAKSAGKPVAGLETFEQQIGYFDGLSSKAQIGFLNDTVEELPKLGTEMGEMVDDWAKGDPAALARLMNDDLQSSPETANVLLYSRNARWADWIANRLKTPGTVFIAVGAGHLAGERSVIEDLKAKHIQVTRVAY